MMEGDGNALGSLAWIDGWTSVWIGLDGVGRFNNCIDRAPMVGPLEALVALVMALDKL